MNLLKDLWGHLKEWNEWKLKDWIKAGILVIIILVVLKVIILPGVQCLKDHNLNQIATELEDTLLNKSVTYKLKKLRVVDLGKYTIR